MDPFCDLIELLRPGAVFSKSITGRGTWGVRYAPYGAPGFAIVLAGRCWLTLEGRAPVVLERGDFVLLPASPAFRMQSDPAAPCRPTEPAFTALRHGEAEGTADFEMLGGSFRLQPVNAPLLTALLPEMVHVRATDPQAGRIERLVRVIMEECADERPGQQAVLARYLEVLLLECLRWPGLARMELPPGLLAGLQDPGLARALGAMHAEVRGTWTVAHLGQLAGMSRSAFSARFSQVLGCPPMEYLARWRMALARDALSRGDRPLDRIAEDIGYESASAFSTAFRRRMGCAPGAFARDLRMTGAAAAP
ncbi:MAG: AraC family transcriptional regulator [Rhodobacteraceae bacterium]|nr:AraC family transcriptional regulator [Paracoccaceae bacterium]MBR9822553.1 AraC family transcriptional regulator [Paracoccaceae bacterium]